MSTPPARPSDAGLLLPGLDGANPLGFLAALGTLGTVAAADEGRRCGLSWHRSAMTWRPMLHGFDGNMQALGSHIALKLHCPFQPSSEAEALRDERERQFMKARKNMKDEEKKLKDEKLDKREFHKRSEQLLRPLQMEAEALRGQWLRSLADAVPSPEQALGKHLNATCSEFRDACSTILDDSRINSRTIIDLMAAFGSEACSLPKSDQIEPTPFCFTTGSGHQYFLDSIRGITSSLTADRIEASLASPAEPTDEKYSMRWDPIEDRRYALMWGDPTGSDSVPKTNWPLNLMAYRGLVYFPSVPTSHGLRSTCWIGTNTRN